MSASSFFVTCLTFKEDETRKETKKADFFFVKHTRIEGEKKAWKLIKYEGRDNTTVAAVVQ